MYILKSHQTYSNYANWLTINGAYWAVWVTLRSNCQLLQAPVFDVGLKATKPDSADVSKSTLDAVHAFIVWSTSRTCHHVVTAQLHRYTILRATILRPDHWRLCRLLWHYAAPRPSAVPAGLYGALGRVVLYIGTVAEPSCSSTSFPILS